MEAMRRGGAAELTATELRELLPAAAPVLVDLGCGDGSFVHRFAGAHREWFCIGLDPDREALATAARRAARRPERGGRGNVLYAVATLEAPPPELSGRAAAISIYFPWAGLLEQIVKGSPAVGETLRLLAADDCLFALVINADAEVPGLELDEPAALAAALGPQLGRAGFTVERADWLPAEEMPPSRWGGRLVKGSGRRMLRLVARRGAPGADLFVAVPGAGGAA